MESNDQISVINSFFKIIIHGIICTFCTNTANHGYKIDLIQSRNSKSDGISTAKKDLSRSYLSLTSTKHSVFRAPQINQQI